MAEKLTEQDTPRDDDEQYVVVESDPGANTEAADAEERTATGSADDGENAAGSAEDDEREAIRERRRREKLERKERRDQAISRDKLELDFLRQRNDELERRLTAQEQRAQNSDLATLDAQIRQAANEAAMAERVIAKAVEAGNGSDVTQAMRYRDQALARAQQLAAFKQQAEQRARTPAEPAIDSMTLHYAKQFIADHPWYDAQGRDEDSAVVLAIDQAMAKDGYNPQTEEYWTELRNRVERRLPDKFDRSSRTPRRGPAVGGGREHAPTSTRKEVYISPERKQALLDAGVWDDPVLRQKYIKRYAEYDRANRG